MENELIEKIKTEATVYGKALGNVGKLRLIGIVSRVLGLFLFIFTLVLCALALFTFGAVAAIDAMSAFMPVWAAALIISSAYVVLIVIAIVCRKTLFIHPFISLMSKQLITSQEQLDIETLKATNNELINTLDDVLKVQEEGRQKRAAAETEMAKMEADLKSKLLELSRTSR